MALTSTPVVAATVSARAETSVPVACETASVTELRSISGIEKPNYASDSRRIASALIESKAIVKFVYFIIFLFE